METVEVLSERIINIGTNVMEYYHQKSPIPDPVQKFIADCRRVADLAAPLLLQSEEFSASLNDFNSQHTEFRTGKETIVDPRKLLDEMRAYEFGVPGKVDTHLTSSKIDQITNDLDRYFVIRNVSPIMDDVISEALTFLEKLWRFSVIGFGGELSRVNPTVIFRIFRITTFASGVTYLRTPFSSPRPDFGLANEYSLTSVFVLSELLSQRSWGVFALRRERLT